ncbi:DUF429 domain-containing protein [Paracoccus tibetensis]|uniref:Predicted nuclease (RNAse H fold) n=1 Tax=Paracoccus tibetensis TaxID=336292 RepID=A0A1G5IKJ0_9RHOB|nr:DUF429 domain-containing protein [Paracoccus tibetensis]SCY76220.1 Predicted nuclease (RNAse H fold) [Paracoccus tibetensis]
MKVLGLDGCKGGWIGIVTDPAFAAPAVIGGSDLGTLIAASGAEVAVIDIPLGLSASEPARACDIAARAAMRGKAASVFNTPVRDALAADDYAAALAVNRRLSGKGFAKQAWGIVPKIREADVVARRCAIPLREGHPELSFTLANGGTPILAPKSSAAGLFLRLQVLARLGLRLERLDLAGMPPGAAADDLADAAIMAWSASRLAGGRAALYPPTSTCDAFGLPMQMVA